MKGKWAGVIPAITTPLDEHLRVDLDSLAEHAKWLIDQGCAGLVPLGSLGEGATLGPGERRHVLHACVEAAAGRVPVIPGISALSTGEAVALARDARQLGCAALMVLPPYVYSTDWHEMRAHVEAVIDATDLPCMLYNNPAAYRTDFLPSQIAELAAACPQLEAVKESSGDVRRVTAIRGLVGERLEILVGLDDAILEGLSAGAGGWIAGLANAFPAESVALYRHAREGRREEAAALYRWFLPLLRMDTEPKFVQLIKLVQERVGRGNARVRPPRLPLEGEELRRALATIERALETRPPLRQ